MTFVFEHTAFDAKDICRLCLRDIIPLYDIFTLDDSNDTNEPSYAKMISTIGNIPVHESDGFPSQICNVCKENLILCYKFKENVLRTFDILCRAVVPENKKLPEQVVSVDIKTESDLDLDVKCDIDPFEAYSPNNQDSDSDEPLELKVHRRKSIKKKKSFSKNSKSKLTKNDRVIAALQRVHKNRNTCPLCLEIIDKSQTMSEHFYSHYQDSNLTPLVVDCKKIKSCNLCNKDMVRHDTLVPHHRVHLKISPYKCEVEGCTEAFPSPKYLTLHMGKHQGLEKYQCKTCGKTFRLRSSLSNHEEIHILDETRCEVCNKMCKNKSALKCHMKRHKNHLKYKCKYEECDKAYHSIQELNRHHRHHLGKSFICDVCNKAWYTVGELDRHKRYHNPVRQHQCNYCFKSFVGRGQLRIHEMAHRGERPFVCEFCSFSFTIRYKLKRHMLICKAAKNISAPVQKENP